MRFRPTVVQYRSLHDLSFQVYRPVRELLGSRTPESAFDFARMPQMLRFSARPVLSQLLDAGNEVVKGVVSRINGQSTSLPAFSNDALQQSSSGA